MLYGARIDYLMKLLILINPIPLVSLTQFNNVATRTRQHLKNLSAYLKIYCLWNIFQFQIGLEFKPVINGRIVGLCMNMIIQNNVNNLKKKRK